LLGNEFTLDNKGTYGNVMEKLINSIKLISFNYMYSSNKTLDRFGIEYSYIASAMGNMLKSTNNGIKNISIDKAVGIAIDWTWGCIITTGFYIATIVLIVLAAIFVWPVSISLISIFGAISGAIGATYGEGNACFGGW
jgi:hypothetical protein